VERLIFWSQHRRHSNPEELDRWLEQIRHGRLKEALKLGRESCHPVVHALHGALRHGDRPLSDTLGLAVDEADEKTRETLPGLDTVITLAPLLGIFGTVAGIVKAFDLLGRASPTPQAVSVGIAEALITTEFGLAIAMPALVFYNLFLTLSDRFAFRLERHSHEFEALYAQARAKPTSLLEAPLETHA
jgi:biopolymer transport protein ExbB